MQICLCTVHAKHCVRFDVTLQLLQNIFSICQLVVEYLPGPATSNIFTKVNILYVIYGDTRSFKATGRTLIWQQNNIAVMSARLKFKLAIRFLKTVKRQLKAMKKQTFVSLKKEWPPGLKIMIQVNELFFFLSQLIRKYLELPLRIYRHLHDCLYFSFCLGLNARYESKHPAVHVSSQSHGKGWSL